MRTRFLPGVVAAAIALGLVTALPATATYAVASIAFPGAAGEFYSPFGGPATVTFTFDGSENDATFEVLIRPAGDTKVHSKPVFIDPDTMTSPHEVPFSWPAISVGSARTYVVAVYRNGTLQGAESFQLHPPLARITSIAPNPFFPWIDNAHKDTTSVAFQLVADSAAEARVFRTTGGGTCCGALVRDDDLGNLTAGNKNWIWDGRNDNGDNLAKGDYFVRIWANDGIVSPAQSKPVKVTIARTYRAAKTKSKTASAYHHVGPVTPLVLGGDCFVYRNNGLQILCQGARVSVYWRWGLASDERIERASFVLHTVDGCPRSIRRTAHTKHESSFTVNEDLVGTAGHCRLATARITYSFLENS